MRYHCLLYYITNRSAFEGDEPTRRRRLLEKIAEAARAGVDYIQLREKDLSAREMEELAREVAAILRSSQSRTALLINSRADVALATQADGVHLRADDILPPEVRKIWSCATGERSPQDPIIAVSCHSPAEVAQAAQNNASFAVFGPVFQKVLQEKEVPEARPVGLAALKEACRSPIPVLALGGVTLENAQSCLEAGAAGIAAIRLFQENNIAQVVQKLRR
jgi:thiamine-phosphate pyrophosphorylase